MALKYRFNLKDIKLQDFKVYLVAMFKGILPKKKIKNIEDLKEFIQQKSAWVSQVTLYNYLKTRMGTKWVLHFDDEKFLKSINTAKWNIYAISLQDLSFYTISYLSVFFNYQETNKAKEIFFKILDDEISNKMPLDLVEETKKIFNERFQNINWNNYCNDLPFNPSALSLFKWAPIADELKSLDRKIVLNSMILKWDIIKKEFKERIKF